MKLKKVSIEGLSKKLNFEFNFNDDINIITGTNGSGKTTLLKILWYTISGNIERILPEIGFKKLHLETSNFSVNLENTNEVIQWKYTNFHSKTKKSSKEGKFELEDSFNPFDGSDRLNRLIIENSSSSLFFPTFRRIEGGYSMTNTRMVRRRARVSNGELVSEMIERDDIQDDFDALSNRLSVANHKFICSISTHDIVSLLTTRYALNSERLNEHYLKFSSLIIDQIENAKSDIQENKEKAFSILSDLQKEADNVNKKREDLLNPFNALSELASKIFQHKGIKIKSITLGKSVDAIDSGVLSAGEKQMLSFLCYNAFYDDAIIFIDEPELSLHPDWQRKLFPTLFKQKSSNQFIVATHSPFIYSKYEDKEIFLSKDKGE
jgi:predicted ATP-binding protein involved in virulence